MNEDIVNGDDTKKNVLKFYYDYCYEVLKNCLGIKYKPELKLTYAKGYDGQIKRVKYKHNNEYVYVSISLSRFNLYVSDWLIEECDIMDIIDTICHELAHIRVWEHGDAHNELTDRYKAYVHAERHKPYLKLKKVI
jgi:hypothetical protein